ncbi:MAG: TIR domain-containing protein [Chloroflexi bacterium]|nr:TIR domain-containing protein [Chloroflexota bacterium]
MDHSPSFVYLSYHGDDADFALALASQMKNRGARLWMDRLDIPPHADWNPSISDALSRCSSMLVVVSPQIVGSPYMRYELGELVRRNLPVLPLLVKPVTDADWPKEIKTQSVDFRSWRDERIFAAQLDRLIRAMQQHTGFADAFGDPPAEELQYLNDLIARVETRRGVAVNLTRQEGERSRIRPNPFAGGFTHMPYRFNLLRSNIGPSTRLADRDKRLLRGIEDAVEQLPRFVMVGEPGSGKTTTLRRLVLRDAWARKAGNTGAPLPIFRYLPRWKHEQSIIEFIMEDWPLSTDVITLIAAGEGRLYLDGLSEMGGEGPYHAGQLRDWFRSLDAPLYVTITSRVADYSGDMMLDLPIVMIEPMRDISIRELASDYLGEKAEPFLNQVLLQQRWQRHYKQGLYNLSPNPFLLTALMLVYERSPKGTLPYNNGVLFQEMVRALWEREGETEPPIWVEYEEMEKSLARLALAMLDNDMPVDVPVNWAIKQVGQSILLTLAHNASILEIRAETSNGASQHAPGSDEGGGQLRFYHQLMQEYFAAVGLRIEGFESRLPKPAFNSQVGRTATKWDQAIMALCGIADDPSAMVTQIAEVDPFLAASCISTRIIITDKVRRSVEDRLVEHLMEGDMDVKKAAAKALAEIGDRPAVQGLFRVYGRAETATRRIIVQTVQDIHNPAAVTSLLDQLYNPNPEVRRAVARALGVIGDPSAINSLRDSLHDSSQDVRLAAAIALGRIADPQAVPWLRMAMRDPEKDVTLAVVRALGQIGNRAALEALMVAFRNIDYDVHWQAVSVVRDLIDNSVDRDGHRAAVAALSTTLNDKKWYVRHNAARLLGKSGDAEATQYLLPLLQDSDADVRLAAIWATGALNQQMAVPGLLDNLADEAPAIRAMAAWALGQIGSIDAKAALVDSMNDHDEVREGYRVSDAAAMAMDKISRDEVLGVVARQLKRPS